MSTATYLHDGASIDHRPVADVPAGAVVEIGGLKGVATRPIKAGELGSLRLRGVFEFVKAPAQSFTAGSSINWNVTGVEIEGGSYLGVVIEAAPVGTSTVKVLIR